MLTHSLGGFLKPKTKETAHLYNNHIDQAKEQLSRDLRSLPTIIINPNIKNINDFKFEDFELVDYHPHPHIKASVSV